MVKGVHVHIIHLIQKNKRDLKGAIASCQCFLFSQIELQHLH